jgi:hypothetical protein
MSDVGKDHGSADDKSAGRDRAGLRVLHGCAWGACAHPALLRWRRTFGLALSLGQ